ncbi:MAG: hypothetical protein KC456_11170 [Flavobacteriales bacterium]|nr:hypothetical protein [Flavobacteriales bacterium]
MRLLLSITVIILGMTNCTPTKDEGKESNLVDSTETVDVSKVPVAADKYGRAFSKAGNIFVVTKDAISKQVTFSSRDSHPILDKKENKVFFIRAFRMTRERKVGLFRTETDNFNKYSFMSVELDKLTEETITDTKPFQSQDPEGGIYIIDQPTLDPDGDHLYFITGKYATGNELVKVNLRTGEWRELFAADYFERILSVNYLGYFLVGQSTIEERGRDIYYRLIDPNGKIVKKFDSKSSMESFRRSQNIVCQNELAT